MGCQAGLRMICMPSCSMAFFKTLLGMHDRKNGRIIGRDGQFSKNFFGKRRKVILFIQMLKARFCQILGLLQEKKNTGKAKQDQREHF